DVVIHRKARLGTRLREDVEVAPAREIFRAVELLASVDILFALEDAIPEPAQVVEISRSLVWRQVLVNFRFDERAVSSHQIDNRSHDRAIEAFRVDLDQTQSTQFLRGVGLQIVREVSALDTQLRKVPVLPAADRLMKSAVAVPLV